MKQNYEKKYKEALDRAKICYRYSIFDAERNALKTIFPELQESEDEKNANALIGLLNDERVSVLMTYEARQQWLNWLKRKKIPSVSFNPALGFNPGSAVVYHNDESEDEKMIGTIRLALTDVPEERFTTEGTSLSKVYAWIDKKKEQEKCPEYCVRSHCIGCSIYEKQKEQKPILEVFGFKVGDKVRLKDGDGRVHIIKKFEKIEGIHGPDFYQVEFEDNSARDGIYPGEEYPNDYYTQMEKIEEEQKPVEWSEENEKDMAHIIRILDDCYAYGKHDLSKTDHENLVNKLKSLHPQPKNEWSEEDEDMLNRCISSIDEAKENRYYYKETDGDTSYDEEIKWLKSLRPQPKK